MKQEFTELFEYSHHFNQKLIAVLLEHTVNVPEKSQKLMSHILNSHQVWNSRIVQEPSFQVWQINDWNELAKIDRNNYQITLDLLEQEDLSRVVHYANSNGDRFSNTVKDILFHVINHSTYHRAQIASDIKQVGINPPVTDYISYKREADL